jgi:DNA repair ATPase RecN
MTPVELRSMADTLGGRRDAILSRLKTASAREESLVQRKAAIDALMLAVQKAARDTQDQLRVRIEDVVQTALDAVFPSMYTFRTEFVARRGRTELDMWLDKDGTRMDPLDSNGGGVVDVLSLSLRICCLTMSGNARVLLLDEPFKFIRGRARQRLGDMLSRLSRRLGIQVIMVSDVSDTGIIPDREFRVSLDRSRHSVVTMTESEATEA